MARSSFQSLSIDVLSQPDGRGERLEAVIWVEAPHGPPGAQYTEPGLHCGPRSRLEAETWHTRAARMTHMMEGSLRRPLPPLGTVCKRVALTKSRVALFAD